MNTSVRRTRWFGTRGMAGNDCLVTPLRSSSPLASCLRSSFSCCFAFCAVCALFLLRCRSCYSWSTKNAPVGSGDGSSVGAARGRGFLTGARREELAALSPVEVGSHGHRCIYGHVASVRAEGLLQLCFSHLLILILPRVPESRLALASFVFQSALDQLCRVTGDHF